MSINIFLYHLFVVQEAFTFLGLQTLVFIVIAVKKHFTKLKTFNMVTKKTGLRFHQEKVLLQIFKLEYRYNSYKQKSLV